MSINSALTLAYNQLSTFAGLDDFWGRFDTAFGANYDRTMALTFQSQWLAGDFSLFPQIEVLDSSILGDANGAYATSTNQIYLSNSFLANSTPEAISAVLLEEIGHFIDAQINLSDSVGDEGEIWSNLVLNKPMTAAQLDALKNENDWGTIAIDNQVISIEKSAGYVDVGFGGGDGIVNQSGLENPTGILVQPDGKILVLAEDSSDDAVLLRYNSDGSLDTTFGGGDGIVNADYYTDGGNAKSLALTTGGKIVVLQDLYTSLNGNTTGLLSRYNNDGTLDTTFDGDGHLLLPGFLVGYDDVVVQADGKILVVENIGGYDTTISDLSLVRYNVDGSLDTTFGNGGKVQENGVAGILDEPNVLLQSDGKILVGTTKGNNVTRFELIRYNPDGSPDNSFGTGGSVSTQFRDSFTAELDLIVLQNDGKTIAAGRNFLFYTDAATVIARYNADGTLDTSFGGGDGWVDWSYNAGATDSVKGLTIQADGKILVMSELDSGQVYLSRLNSNGSFDTTFKGDTIGITGQGGNEETLTLQADGKILAVTEDSQGILITRISSSSNDVFFGSATYVVNEDGSAISAVTINRAGDLTKAFSVTVTPSNGTATNGDYTNTPIVVNFLANETSNVITIPITNDSLAEGDETINLTLSNPTNGFNLAGQTTATLTITENDNDSPITLIVNTTSDEADGTNSGTGLSLRDAIITANNDTTRDYIIQLQGGQTYSLSIKNTAPVHQGGDEQAALRGDLDILGGGRITIKSVGTQKAIIDATNLKTNFASGFGDAAFDLKDNSHLILDGVTVTGASIAAVFIADTAIAEILNSTITNNVITVASAGNEINQDGGGIFNAGTLILKNSLISNNKAAGFGGGIYNYGKSTAIILNSTLNGNTAGGYGGGIGNSGIANIINSTISNNSSEQYGGGISNAGIATFTNSTISGNTAKQSGGGIFSVNLTSSTVTGKVYLNNSTITNNTADLDSTSDGTGGGIYNIDGYGEVYARNTIIAGNFNTPNNNGSGSGATYNPDISGTIYGNNYNLVGNKTGASGTIGTGTDIVNANPLLGTLQNNGGSTQTHALLTGSPALNKGNNALIAKDVFDIDNDGNNTETIPFDNRGSGYTRIYGGTVDIGAFELQLPAINLGTNQSIVEGFTSPQNLGYTVTLSIASTQTITVQYATANGTAIAASDYTSTSGTLTFNPGVTSQVINIPILNDSINEANETFTLALSSPTNANLGTTTTVTTTITDTLTASVTTTLPANVENLTLTGTTAINGTGNAGNNIITGNTVNNILNGGAGNDTLIGGLGNDIYQVDSTTDVITENASEGTDTIQSSVTFSLAALPNIENLTLTGSSIINGTGNAANNVLTGNTANNTLNGGDGNDTLNGGTGVDTLIGGLGNDIYQVDSTTDVITENASEGTDTIQSSVTYTIASLPNIENLTLTASSVINGTGNAGNNILTGNTANNTLNGGDGNDTLNGGAGNDTLIGGNGNDFAYYYSSTASVTVNLATGTVSDGLGGTDTLSFIENVQGSNTAGDNLTGDANNNIFYGYGGNDTLNGGDGNDTLIGGAGNDLLTGGNGTDTAYYYSVTGAVTANLATGTASDGEGGTDTLSQIENVQGSNAAGDNLTGNTGVNVLYGYGGADILTGGGGNDLLYLGSDTVKDTVNYASGDGADTVYNFVRGAGGDILKFTSITAIDVQVSGSNTLFKVGDGISGNAGFGSGTLLLTTSATSGFGAADVNVNLLGATFAFS
jgi:uncharacterized delta-60 repeat protein